MQWNHFQCCARGIFTKFGEFDDFLRFLRIFPQFIIILILVAIHILLGTRNIIVIYIKLLDYQGCQIAWYFSWIWLFFCGFKHFSSIYHQFDFRNMVPLAIPLPWGTKNLMVTYKTVSVTRIARLCEYFSKHFPSILSLFWLLEHDSCGYTHAFGGGGQEIKWWHLENCMGCQVYNNRIKLSF